MKWGCNRGTANLLQYLSINLSLAGEVLIVTSRDFRVAVTRSLPLN